MEHLKNGTELIGSHTRVKVVKNKVAPPFKQAEFDIMYGEGISRTSELVDLGVEFGILSKSGAWFSMGDTVWVRAVMLPSSISRIIRTSRMTFRSRSWKR